MIDQQLLDEIVARLQPTNAKKMFLFGSQATGTSSEESDIDLLLVKDSVVSRIKEMNDARKLLRGLGKSFDIVVSTREEFEFYRNQVNSVHHAADNYGKVIYG
jgi:predicted nucleotidyltransferase